MGYLSFSLACRATLICYGHSVSLTVLPLMRRSTFMTVQPLVLISPASWVLCCITEVKGAVPLRSTCGSCPASTHGHCSLIRNSDARHLCSLLWDENLSQSIRGRCAALHFSVPSYQLLQLSFWLALLPSPLSAFLKSELIWVSALLPQHAHVFSPELPLW